MLVELARANVAREEVWLMSYGKRIAAVAMLVWIAVAGCGGSPELIVPGFDGGGGLDAGPETVIPNNTSDRTIVTTTPDGGTGGSGDDVSVLPPIDGGPVCGNGVIESGERCDDGNSTPGDGCNGVCQIEPNWVCPDAGQKCTYSPNSV